MVDFPTTIWTNIRQAVTSGGSVNPAVMSSICEVYDQPLRTLIRSICPSDMEAEDLAQEFIFGLSQGKYLSAAAEERGRLRYFLFQCGQYYVLAATRRKHAMKRGGNSSMVSIDAEAGCPPLVSPEANPADAFDKAWAQTMISRTIAALESDHSRRGKGDHFPHLLAGLGWTPTSRSTTELADACKMTPNAFTTAIHRLRERFGDQMRQEIRETVSTDEEVADELQYLLTALSN